MENKEQPSFEKITLENHKTCTRIPQIQNKVTTLEKKIVSLEEVTIKILNDTECNCN